MVHVPYRASPPAITDLLAGQVQVYFAPISASIEYVRAGKLRALAVTSATRSAALPDIPTLADFASSRAQSRKISASGLTIRCLSVSAPMERLGIGNSTGTTLSSSWWLKRTMELDNAVTKRPDATSSSSSGSENVATRIGGGSRPAARNPCAR
jgi:hypothetical protein